MNKCWISLLRAILLSVRLFPLILSLFILALSVLPCTDHEHGTQEQMELADFDHDHEEEDTCSPFCVCACCGTVGIVTTTAFFNMLHKEYVTQKIVTFYNSRFYSSYFFSFWQPPKI